MPTPIAPPTSIRSYQSHGLTIASGLPLPFADHPGPDGEDADVVITCHRGTEGTGGSSTGDARLVYGGGIVFDMRAGRRIDVRAPVETDPALPAALITTGPWKALLLQRGLLPFRGCALDYGGGALAIVGRRGAGASTLALALMSRGARLISDGLFTVERDPLGRPCIPGGQIRLDVWEDTVTAWAGERPRVRLRAGIPRYGVPTPSPSRAGPPLRRLWLIAPGRAQTTSFRRLAANEGLERLLSLTDRHLMVRSPSLRPRLFQEATEMVAAASVLEVSPGQDLMALDGDAAMARLDTMMGEA